MRVSMPPTRELHCVRRWTLAILQVEQLLTTRPQAAKVNGQTSDEGALLYEEMSLRTLLYNEACCTAN